MYVFTKHPIKVGSKILRQCNWLKQEYHRHDFFFLEANSRGQILLRNTLYLQRTGCCFHCGAQSNHLSDILSSLGYTDPQAIFGDTYRERRDKFTPVLHV